MRVGFSYEDAFHMSYRDARRYAALSAAWSVPADEQDGGARIGTADDAAAIFRTG